MGLSADLVMEFLSYKDWEQSRLLTMIAAMPRYIATSDEP